MEFGIIAVDDVEIIHIDLGQRLIVYTAVDLYSSSLFNFSVLLVRDLGSALVRPPKTFSLIRMHPKDITPPDEELNACFANLFLFGRCRR